MITNNYIITSYSYSETSWFLVLIPFLPWDITEYCDYVWPTAQVVMMGDKLLVSCHYPPTNARPFSPKMNTQCIDSQVEMGQDEED